MDHFYYYCFAVMLSLTVGFELKKTPESKSKDTSKGPAEKMSSVFLAFRNNYLVVYTLMMGTCIRLYSRWDVITFNCVENCLKIPKHVLVVHVQRVSASEGGF
jgi:hypothetical protein